MCTVIFDAVDVFEEFYILVKNHKVERRIGTRAFRFYVALAYLPAEKEKLHADHTILPDEIEYIPPKFAINYRNKFMIEAADIVVTYVKHSWGGAAKYKRLAEKKNRRVIELST